MSMSEAAEELAEGAASRVFREAIDEVEGRSSRTWAMVVVGVACSAAVAVVIVKLLERRSAV